MQWAMGSSATEGLCGATAAVLAILGLAHVHPGYMAAIATIAVGVALLLEGGAVMARQMRWQHGQHMVGHEMLGHGITVEFLGGITGTVLGVLALLGITPEILVPAAAIVFGAALLFGFRAPESLPSMAAGDMVGDHAQQVTRGIVEGAVGAHVLVGLAAGVLGILALVGEAPLTLTLVALLAVGATTAASGGAIASRVASVFYRW